MLVSFLVLFAQISQTAPARQVAVQQRVVTPTLSFPDAGLDDTAAYQGYQTRLYRDAASNTVQIYLDRREGRVVHILADAENASAGFTARLPGGGPAPLEWGAPGATVSQAGRRRSIAYAVRSDTASIALGWFVLGSMRVERDFLHGGGHRRPFASPAFAVEELVQLTNALEQLPAAERQRHLRVLNATSVANLRARLRPTVTIDQRTGRWSARVVQLSLDGRDTMSVALVVDPRRVRGVAAGDSIVLTAVDGGGVRFEVQLSTTGATLAPLARGEIFTPDFLAFLDSARAAASRDAEAQVRARWMERQVRGVELLASREKLMAGLPTYATYFGRDMLVTTLMMRSIWRDDMSAFAIAAALRKLSPMGEVSHEEALGGQAVREAAAEYAALLRAQDAARGRGDVGAADSLLARALDVLRQHRRVRENYHMIDDELQLPVLVASWISNPNVSVSRKRAFLREVDGGNVPRLTRLLRELALVARMTAPYAASPSVETLIAFAPRAEGGWASTSWRDSGAGYAGGRYAMDVNAIWAPHALQGARTILRILPTLGFSLDSLARANADVLGNTPLRAWTRDSTSLARAVETWMGAGRHFVVRLGPDEVRARVAQRLAAMPNEERTHWRGVLDTSGADRDSLVFLALSLDARGAPIGVVNTDIGTRLFLGDPLHGAIDPAVVLRDSRLFVRPYPVGLFVERVGPVVANDAFAADSVWDAFVRDAYHGPRVAWGREVNLFLLGVAQQVGAAGGDATPYSRELRAAAERVVAAVDAAGFRSELWSYDFSGGAPTPVRYGSGGDVQLWSTTDLAVQYMLARMRW
ncbi:MAG: hypothetical protein IT360_16080 [Gemmatimonadaceae bacterium]|nr:hypothetical protein [Gemmatimonadaceae bacterium]